MHGTEKGSPRGDPQGQIEREKARSGAEAEKYYCATQ